LTLVGDRRDQDGDETATFCENHMYPAVSSIPPPEELPPMLTDVTGGVKVVDPSLGSPRVLHVEPATLLA
jgi:hypothetical protein